MFFAVVKHRVKSGNLKTQCSSESIVKKDLALSKGPLGCSHKLTNQSIFQLIGNSRSPICI